MLKIGDIVKHSYTGDTTFKIVRIVGSDTAVLNVVTQPTKGGSYTVGHDYTSALESLRKVKTKQSHYPAWW